MGLAENLNRIRSGIGAATLVAATKTVGPDVIRTLFSLGVRDVGENRADAYLAKRAALPDLPLRWHFIGHLQTNKAAAVLPSVDVLHSLDSLALAREIEKRRSRPLPCFVEVNVSGEAAKYGVAPADAESFVQSLAEYGRIEVIGLMGMAAATADARATATAFRTLAQLRDRIRARGWPWAPCTELSMGMSGDYPIAVREGATFVRIGSKLFESEDGR